MAGSHTAAFVFHVSESRCSRIVEARLEAPQLLFLGDVQVELQNVRARSSEFLFESVGLVVTRARL